MFGEKQNYFKNGRIDQAALVSFIKDIKKNIIIINIIIIIMNIITIKIIPR